MAGSAAPEWATWQLLDSLLPTGAFAHSLGLEAALRQGWLEGGTGAPGVFPFGPPVLGQAPWGPDAGGGPQGSMPVHPGGPSGGAAGEAVRVFALSVMANVAAQLLPFVVAAHVCMSAAAGAPHGTPQAALAGPEGASHGAQPEQWAFELVAEGIRATFWAPPLGEQGWSEGGQASAGLGQHSPRQAGAGEGGGLSPQARAVQAWVLLDNILQASLSNHVARRASGTQGTALLRAALTIAEACAAGGGKELGHGGPGVPHAGTEGGPGIPHAGTEGGDAREAAQASAGALPLLKTLRGRVGSRRGGHTAEAGAGRPLGAHGHHATVFGAAAALLGVPALNAARGYLYGALRDVLSAATRLNCIGPLEAAGLQASLAGAGERMLQRSCAGQALAAPQEEGGSFAAQGAVSSGASHVWRSLVGSASVQQPLVDVVHAAHDSLPMRLFLS